VLTDDEIVSILSQVTCAYTPNLQLGIHVVRYHDEYKNVYQEQYYLCAAFEIVDVTDSTKVRVLSSRKIFTGYDFRYPYFLLQNLWSLLAAMIQHEMSEHLMFNQFLISHPHPNLPSSRPILTQAVFES
jgi:hypothetical protein